MIVDEVHHASVDLDLDHKIEIRKAISKKLYDIVLFFSFNHQIHMM